MIKITKELDYALILLTALSQNKKGEYIGLKTVSKHHHLPYKFIGAIALKLKDDGILTSKEGAGGGYRLKKDPNKITLNQIITSLHGPVTPDHHMDCVDCPSRSSCQHQQSFSSLIRTIAKNLDQTTLAEIINA